MKIKSRIYLNILFFIYSTILFAQKNEAISGSTDISQKKFQVGIKANIGILNIPNFYHNAKPLIRTTFAISLLQNISEKSKFQYEIYNSIYGSKYVNKNIPTSVFFEFKYLGVSIDYLKRPINRKPLFVGIGIFNDFLYKDVTITENNDGRTEIPNFKSFSKINFGGQLKVQYHINMFKKNPTIAELKYARGFTNIYNKESIKVTGRKAYPEGIFLNLGVFF